MISRVNKKIFLIFFISSILSSCFKNSTYKINGRLDTLILEQLNDKLKDIKTLIVNSAGGDVEPSAKIAELISKHRINIIIKNKCISACVEFILPATKSIKFENRPIVGFHWGPMMDFGQYSRHFDRTDLCDFSTLSTQKTLYAKNNLNPHFWLEIEKRLSLKMFRLEEKEGEVCPWKIRVFENSLWLPTSLQLATLWGLEFSGSVCADEYAYCTKRVDQLWKKGTRIVIGDKVYISKGP